MQFTRYTAQDIDVETVAIYVDEWDDVALIAPTVILEADPERVKHSISTNIVEILCDNGYAKYHITFYDEEQEVFVCDLVEGEVRPV